MAHRRAVILNPRKLEWAIQETCLCSRSERIDLGCEERDFYGHSIIIHLKALASNRLNGHKVDQEKDLFGQSQPKKY